MSDTKPTVGIIGYGRFGQFWGDVLRRDHDVLVTDTADRREVAAKHDVQFVSITDLCAQADSIFLCVPINRVEDTVRGIRPYLKAGKTILDTCSVKLHPAAAMLRHLGGFELIATHPMFGPDSGSESLEDLPIVMWPLEKRGDSFDYWKRAFERLGLKTVEMSPEEHDRLAANSQGITHYIGRVLDEMALEATPIDTTGYKTLLEVIGQTARDSWDLFHDLQNYNPYTQDMRLRLETALDRVYSRLLPKSASPHELVIGIQGGGESFNDEACRHYCAEHGIERFRIEYLYTAVNVLEALHLGTVDRGVFAIQNARGGVVMETIAGLSQYRCEIIDKFDIVIRHCIMHHPEADFAEVDTILSHPQAIAQCRRSLRERYPEIEVRSEEGDLIDQALCAQYIAEGKLPRTTAVLAPRVCADIYGLTIEARDLQDLGDENVTTFVWTQRRHYFR